MRCRGGFPPSDSPIPYGPGPPCSRLPQSFELPFGPIVSKLCLPRFPPGRFEPEPGGMRSSRCCVGSEGHDARCWGCSGWAPEMPPCATAARRRSRLQPPAKQEALSPPDLPPLPGPKTKEMPSSFFPLVHSIHSDSCPILPPYCLHHSSQSTNKFKVHQSPTTKRELKERLPQ